MNSYLVILLLAGFLISTFFGVVFYMIVGKSKNKRLNDLKGSGKVIDAIITKIQNEAVINRPVVVCRIHAESTIDQIKYEFVSEKVYPQDCKHLQIGDIVKVLINHLNPQKYYFAHNPNDVDY